MLSMFIGLNLIFIYIFVAKLNKMNAENQSKTRQGRPRTGVNTVTISFSLHRDFAEAVKEAVILKIAELKAAKIYSDFLSTKGVEISAVIKPNQAVGIITKAKPTAPSKVKSEAAQSFLDKRRAGKLK